MVLVWLVCVAMTAVSVVAFEGERSSDLVFCPLQNQWVKKAEPPQPKLSLAAICSPGGQKARFLEKLINRVETSVTDAVSLENLFFGFQAKGERAFVEFPPSPGAPDEHFAVIERAQSGTGINRTIAVAVTAQIFSLAQLSRPPTHSPSANFATPRVRQLDPISASVAPRGPPVSL